MLKSPIYPGDSLTRTGEQEISAVARRLQDNLGELAYMHLIITHQPNLQVQL